MLVLCVLGLISIVQNLVKRFTTINSSFLDDKTIQFTKKWRSGLNWAVAWQPAAFLMSMSDVMIFAMLEKVVFCQRQCSIDRFDATMHLHNNQPQHH